MNEITFNNLPEAVTQLRTDISEIKRLLIEKNQPPPSEPPDQLLTITEAGQLLHLSTPTMYSKVSKGELPAMKQGKRLFFSKKELIEIVKSGRKRSNAEIEADAVNYLSHKRK